ncbi:14340_t:CDS:2 [Racocetra fulgida]|uniref:14340_t:CDS:1 n=1 Tax=Racocetra fulgida TaxID=60492 RepID=A0A9N8WM30_9GLOM|nr:14340_t:CDS:2 [Racocetra fulgida]
MATSYSDSPSSPYNEDSTDYTVQRLLIGTHTSDNDQNFVEIAHIQLPKNDVNVDPRKFDEEKGEIGGYGGTTESRIKVVQKIKHEGEVNRARYMPQKQDIIATKTVSGDVYIFDRTKHPLKPLTDGGCQPELKLRGHVKEGPLKEGHILDASEDTTICHWYVNAIGEIGIYDFNLMLLFYRDITDKADKPAHSVIAHPSEVNTLAWNPMNENILVTGAGDKWSPHDETILASAGGDRRVNIWDLSRIGAEQTAEDADEGPPELLVRHTNKISDFSWNPHIPWVISSTAEDNIIQVWQPAANIYSIDDRDIPPEELED